MCALHLVQLKLGLKQKGHDPKPVKFSVGGCVEVPEEPESVY